MRGKLHDFLYISPTKGRLTIDLDGDFRHQYEKLKDCEVEVSIKKWFPERSAEANAYLWTMCSKIANKIGSTKEDVYRREIKEVGEYTPLPIREDAVEEFQRIWSMHGTGWFAEVVDDSKLPGYKLVFAYAGSSSYDSKTFSRLLDNILEEARSLHIEVRSKEEIESLLKEK